MAIFHFLLYFISSKIYLEERFDAGWDNRWSRPSHVKKGIQLGRYRVSAGDYYGNETVQRGLETMEARRHYLIYTNFSHRFDTRNSDLVIQYTLRLNLYPDCAGYYIKLFNSDVDCNHFSNESTYSIMFGPDICGAQQKKTHIILSKDGKYYKYQKSVNCYKDHLTHAYTLIIRKNNTIEYLIDGELIDSEKLENRFSVPLTNEIPDPNDKKPADWDDDEFILDPDDVKPDDWVDDEFIPDPESFRPPTWDDSMIWAPSMIKNPDYKGEWVQRKIKNPKYKGIWMPKMIKVDEAVEDPTFGHFNSLSFLGLEFFQSAPGSIFDNFLITDNETYAQQVLDEVLSTEIRDAEVRNFDHLSNQAVKDKELDKYRSLRDQTLRAKAALQDDDASDSQNKLTPEQRMKLKRQAKKNQARKRAVSKNDDL